MGGREGGGERQIDRDRERHRDTQRQTERQADRGRHRETGRGRGRQTETERQRENSNSITLCYKDCSLGSVKNLTVLAKLLMNRYHRETETERETEREKEMGGWIGEYHFLQCMLTRIFYLLNKQV